MIASDTLYDSQEIAQTKGDEKIESLRRIDLDKKRKELGDLLGYKTKTI